MNIDVKYQEIQARYAKVVEARAKLQGLLEAKRQELFALFDEIKKAGYDPATLKDKKQQLEADLSKQILDYEAKLAEAEAAIKTFESLETINITGPRKK